MTFHSCKKLVFLANSFVFLASSFTFIPYSQAKDIPLENAPNCHNIVIDKDQIETSQAINKWFEDSYNEWLNFSPIQLTFQGKKQRYNEIDDFSIEAEKNRLEWQKNKAEELKQTFNHTKLNCVDQLSYDVWIYNYQVLKAGASFIEHDYLFEQMDGFHSFLPNFLIGFHSVESKQDAEAYVKRIYGISGAISQLLGRSELAVKKGIRPPRFAYEFVLSETKKLLTGQPFSSTENDSPIWADFKTKVSTLEENKLISEAEAQSLLDNAWHALDNAFKPVHQQLIAFVENDIANTDARAEGVSTLPQGQAYYDYMLAYHTTTSLTAEDIHKVGLSEVARLRKEMLAVKAEIGFDGDLLEFFSYVREAKDNPRLYFPNTDKGRNAYIAEARSHIDNIEKQLPDYFGLKPKADVVVKRVEAFREQDGAPQHYYPSAPDGSRPGIYYAHLSDMTSMPRNQLEVIAYHEALPGHHMQIAIAQELESVPAFRRQDGHTAYIEGWALYTEKLAKEIPGTYQDPYADFGRLTSEMMRAIRLVVDTGLHAKGWSEQQAVEFFKNNSAMAEGTIRSEVRRYLVLPGQATSYKIGMLTIENLRKDAEQALGDQFDIREFHDVILGGGSLPLPILEQQVRAWLDSKNNANPSSLGSSQTR